ncbi:LacI family DNA-binding transcriptional regulator [Streptomyces sp. NPDC021080]|uniref:LacI family DNA-binding transcriptional regulator n=1 Tax=Streptomyces sp. NPDC021080 TaxID=3365110 RepID=UPI0037AB12C4
MTSSDVARLAGVSRATVSYVLNNKTGQKISDQTREAVRRAAEELGYRPNEAARRLASGQSRLVLLVLPHARLGEMIVELAATLTSELATRGLTLSTHFQSSGSASIAEVAQRLDASAVVAMVPLPAGESELLAAAGVRVVSSLSDPDAPGFGYQNTIGAMQLRHLHDLGHREIAFAGTDEIGLEPFRAGREAGVRATARELGLPEPREARLAADGSDAATIVQGWHREGVTAVVAYNDDVAFVVLHGIRTAGLACPHDMAVIGMDGEKNGLVSAPPLTTIKPDLAAWAQFSSSVVLQALDSEGSEARPDYPADQGLRVVRRAST